MKLSLPTDSAARKTYPLFSTLFGYFGAALAGVAHHGWKSNEKHNPGEPVHWSMGKSNDHADCCMRHLLDLGELLSAWDRSEHGSLIILDALLSEADALAWRALALNQTLRNRFTNVPTPFNSSSEIETADAAATVARDGA
jgi:hypothetical protein